MKREYSNCIYGGLFGIVIYIINTLIAALVYIPISENVFSFLIHFLLLFSCSIIVLMIVFNKPTFVSLLLRACISFGLFGFLFVINGYIGTLQKLVQLLGGTITSAADNVSGLLVLAHISVLLLSFVITTLCMQLFKLLERARKVR